MSDWLPAAARYIEEWLDLQMRLSKLPGCVLAISQAGTLVVERAFGKADLATGAPLTPRHRFRVASHSKTFTSAGIMKLREEGRLHLDDVIAAYVAGLSTEVGATTFAQLLSHSAGLMRDGSDCDHWLDRQPFLNEAELREQLSGKQTLDANTRFKYSNLGFGLLGLAIEAITGEPYEVWVKRAIIDAAGLTETLPDMPLPGSAPMACGHSDALLLGRRVAIPGRNSTHALASATGFVSTAGDLARFFGQLDPAAPVSVLSAASRREMTRSQWRTPHSAQERYYGLGTMSGQIDGHIWFGHGGAFPGFISRTVAVPEWRVAVSIVTNAVDGWANQWAEGSVGILHHFARNGTPRPGVADWTGRWWSLWGAIDLVPMDGKVLVATPALLTPFTDASELTVTSPTAATISLAGGYGSHGEPVQRSLGPDGGARRLRLSGTELLPEADLAKELADRAASRPTNS